MEIIRTISLFAIALALWTIIGIMLAIVDNHNQNENNNRRLLLANTKINSLFCVLEKRMQYGNHDYANSCEYCVMDTCSKKM